MRLLCLTRMTTQVPLIHWQFLASPADWADLIGPIVVVWRHPLCHNRFKEKTAMAGEGVEPLYLIQDLSKGEAIRTTQYKSWKEVEAVLALPVKGHAAREPRGYRVFVEVKTGKRERIPGFPKCRCKFAKPRPDKCGRCDERWERLYAECPLHGKMWLGSCPSCQW